MFPMVTIRPSDFNKATDFIVRESFARAVWQASVYNIPASVRISPTVTRLRMVYCKRCTKTHAVGPSEIECSPGAWIEY